MSLAGEGRGREGRGRSCGDLEELALVPEALVTHSDLDSSKIWGRFWSLGPGPEAGAGVGTWVGAGVGAGACWAGPEGGRGALLPGWDSWVALGSLVW